MDYKALAKTILSDLGGEENILSFTHCTARLRFNLKDEKKADTEHLKNEKGVAGIVQSGGQYQVVIGNGVANVYRELHSIGNFEQKPEPKNSSNGFKKTLVALMIVSGILGIILALIWLGGISGFPIVMFELSSVMYALIACAAVFFISLIAIRLIGSKNTASTDEPIKEKFNGLCAPLSGKVIPLSEVADETFAQEILGKGAAIVPRTNLLVAPADGRIENIPNSRHAIAMTTTNGIEVLMHIGMDTVELKGKHFKTFVEEGDSVKRGDPLIEFESNMIKSAGYDLTTPIVITNSDKFSNIEFIVDEATEQQPFLKIES